jgi:ADP-ribose pyrophosphatase
MPNARIEPTTLRSPRISTPRVVYRNRYHRVYRLSAAFDGVRKEYFVTDYGGRAGLVVISGECTLLVRQYRVLIDRMSWEIPGGKVDQGETPMAAAARECLEEAGVRCRKLRPLLTFQPGLDTLHNPTYLFYTDRFTAVPKSANASESVESAWFPIQRCIEMVAKHEIIDSLSIIALLSYRTIIQKRGS